MPTKMTKTAASKTRTTKAPKKKASARAKKPKTLKKVASKMSKSLKRVAPKKAAPKPKSAAPKKAKADVIETVVPAFRRAAAPRTKPPVSKFGHARHIMASEAKTIQDGILSLVKKEPRTFETLLHLLPKLTESQIRYQIGRMRRDGRIEKRGFRELTVYAAVR